MKKFLVFPTLAFFATQLIFSMPLLAQNTGADSLQYSQESGALQKQAFVSAADYVFMTRQEAKWMLKANYAAMTSGRSIFGDFEYNLELGGEAKLSPSFSVNGLVGYNHKSEQIIRGFWYAQIEPRWYYNMARRIAAGTSANNFSGNYFAVKLTRFTSVDYQRSDRTIVAPQQRLMLAYGIQRRVFNHGFFDFSMNVGYQQDTDHTPVYVQDQMNRYRLSNWNNTALGGFSARSEVRLGLALGGQKSKAAASSCDIFRCFEEDKSMLKIDMTRLFYVAPNNVNVSLSTAYERKINKSAWSINQEVRLDYTYRFERSYIPHSAYQSEGNTLSGRYVLEPRYYYNLRKRIMQGKSANNLSANYVALHSSNELAHSFLNFSPENIRLRTNFVTSLGVVWGMQRRLFANGFVDAKVGLERNLNKTFHDFIIPGVNPVLDIKIGFAL